MDALHDIDLPVILLLQWWYEPYI